MERLLGRSESLVWIPKDPSRPTHDFLWVNHGSARTEMKTPRSYRYESIRGRIHDAVKSAKQHGITKDVFLIDLGDEKLLPALRSQLARYNQDRQRYQIRELWIMSADGRRLERIHLQ
ncbi:MAG: hypothetical protein Q4G35_06460 [Propionibacteriaceae bacterium]|nr:hypothetical protein [Propionibacteriaceae bacterium]